MLVVGKSRHVGIREREGDHNDTLRYNEVVYARKEEVQAHDLDEVLDGSSCKQGKQEESRKERRDRGRLGTSVISLSI